MHTIKAVARYVLLVCDCAVLPFVVASGLLLKAVRMAGMHRMRLSRAALLRIGIMPVRHHYYEPLFRLGARRSDRQDRNIPGLDLNVGEQLNTLKLFHFNRELLAIPYIPSPDGKRTFYYDNKMFRCGDAEYYYNIIRHFKPRSILEIGGGNSTLLARLAITNNQINDPGYRCSHTVVEPFEARYLEEVGCQVLRYPVETLSPDIVESLGQNDVLFIDSSHVIRPKGDVLFEYLELLPRLKPGVLVQVHDVFTPKHYLDRFAIEQVLFWNEQYLLESFLTLNSDFEVVGALNFLKHHHFGALAECCPVLAAHPEGEPGSFWMRRVQKDANPL